MSLVLARQPHPPPFDARLSHLLWQHEVFLIDSINRKFTDKMPHLKALYFIRPTIENIRLLQAEFKEPKYGEYHIFFSNLARDAFIQELAEADEHEVVQQVQEYYCDFLAINQASARRAGALPTPFHDARATRLSHGAAAAACGSGFTERPWRSRSLPSLARAQELFSLNVPSIVGLGGAAWDQPTFDRVTSGLIAVLLSLKKRPTIRYQVRRGAAAEALCGVGGVGSLGRDSGTWRVRAAPLAWVVALRW